MLANGSAGLSCSTKKCFIPLTLALTNIRLKSIRPVPTGRGSFFLYQDLLHAINENGQGAF